MTDEYIQLGKQQLEGGHPQQALELFLSAYALQPDNPEVLFYLGRAYSDLGQPEEALRRYLLSLQLDPDSVGTLVNIASQYDTLGQHQRAEDYYIRASNLDPGNPAIYLEWGKAYSRQGRHQEALACIEQARRLDPGNPDYAGFEAQKFFDMEQYDDALASAQELIRLRPGDAEDHDLLGDILNALERHEEAIQAYDRAISLDPQYWQAWCDKGYALGLLERYDEALACYQACLRGLPGDAYFWNTCGYILNLLQRYSEARPYLLRAIELDPQYPHPLSNLADTYAHEKDHAKAEELYLKAYSLDPEGRPFDLLDAALCMQSAQRFAESIPPLEKLLPLAQEIGRNVPFALATAYRSTNQPEQALRCYYLQTETFPDWDEIDSCWMHIATLEGQLGNHSRAETAWLRLYEHYTEPDDKAFALYGLGCLRLDQGRCREAVALFDQAIALDPSFDEYRTARRHARRRQLKQKLFS